MIENIAPGAIILTYIMIGVSVAIIVGFAAVKVATNFKQSQNTIIGMVLMLLIFFVSYSASSGADYLQYKAEMGITETTSKLVNAGLITFLITAGIAIVSILYAEISKAIK